MKPTILALTAACVFFACSVESGSGDPDPGDVDASASNADAASVPQADAATVGDVATYCNDFAAIVCGKLFTCMTAEERAAAGVPPTEEECLAAQQAPCATATSSDICEEGQVYQPDQATPCVTQFGQLTCEQFLDPDTDAVLAEAAPACLAMCE
jgi:hypothetical protein